MSQLELPLKLQDHAVFDSFWSPGNETLVAYLESLSTSAEGPGCWMWGPPASGKSHLLQAVCERAGSHAVYLPMKLVAGADAGVLEGLASRRYVCLDDLHLVAGNEDFELALFNLYNEVSDADGVLIATATSTPRECRFKLPDLASRLSMLPIFRLAALDDSNRAEALKLRARHRGLELPDDTVAYLLKRTRRDMASLYSMLDQLEEAALSAGRRLTIRFVRDTLGAS